MGFVGTACWATSGAPLVCPPLTGRQRAWPAPRTTGLAGNRPDIATVPDRLLGTVRLDRERSHDMTGRQTRLAAVVARVNCCIWLNRTYGRPDLAMADLIAGQWPTRTGTKR